jgi:Flagellar biosynthesis protein, FliO
MEQAGMEGQRERPELGGVAGWLWMRLRRNARPRPRLALVERIALGPRQSLALVEADGRRLLVATSAEGSPAFYPLAAERKTGRARVSW